MTGGVKAVTANMVATSTVTTGTLRENFQSINGRSARPLTHMGLQKRHEAKRAHGPAVHHKGERAQFSSPAADVCPVIF